MVCAVGDLLSTNFKRKNENMKTEKLSSENVNANGVNHLLAAALVAPYLPYSVMAYDERQENKTDYIAGMYRGNLDFENWSPIDCGQIENYKLCLRPMSDLGKEIEHNGIKFIPIIELFKVKNQKWILPKETYLNEIDYSCDGYPRAWFKYRAQHDIIIREFELLELPYYLFNKLCEWHFDVFGLIPQKLAVAL